MTYEEFLQFIGNGCTLIFNSISLFANSLLHNYIFLTLLGLSIFISLFWWFYNNFVIAPLKVKDNCDKWVDLKRNYKQFIDMKYNFTQTNRYDIELLNYANLCINRDLYNQFLDNKKDLAFTLSYKSLDIKDEANKLLRENKNQENKIFKRWERELQKHDERPPTKKEIQEVDDLINDF